MANRAYLSVWTRGFSEATMLEQFERILATIPCSAARPGYSHLLVQAVGPSETPVAEWDLGARAMAATDVTALTRELVHSDSAYIAGAHWDLWVFQSETEKWVREPQPLTLTCHGPEYDGGAGREAGNFQADLGLEHVFTGHAGLLGLHPAVAAP